MFVPLPGPPPPHTFPIHHTLSHTLTHSVFHHTLFSHSLFHSHTHAQVSPCHEFVKDLLHTLLSLTSTDSTNTNTKPPTAGTDAEGAAADAEDTPTTTTTTPTPSSSSLMSPGVKLQQPYTAPGFSEPPQRRSDINFTRYSWVLQHPAAAACSLLPTAPCQYRGDCPKGE